MSDAHGGLGELLVVLYLVVAIGSLVTAKRRGLPSWLTGTAHSLLAIQVVMGIILYARNTDIMPLSHVIAGLLTLPALGLAVALRGRLGRARAVAASSFAIAILAAVAVVIAVTR